MILTFIVFYPATRGEFVNFDDLANFVENERNLKIFTGENGGFGLNGEALKWAFTAYHVGVYTPVSWLTVAADVAIAGGVDSYQIHLTNVLFHSANAALFFFLLLSLLRWSKRPLSWSLLAACAFGALFFSLHPLRVEIVAWASARNNLVGAFFALLSVLAYLKSRGVEGRAGAYWMVASVALYAVAMLAKAYVLPLPLVLALLDYYPLRLTRDRTAWVRDLIGKGAWLGLGLFLVFGFMKMMNALLGMPPMFEVADPDLLKGVRPAIAAYALWASILKTFIPTNLVAYVPIPRDISLFGLPYLPGYVLAIGGTGLAIVLRNRAPAFFVAWFAGLFLLGPVSGIVPLGTYIFADRYTYLATLPIAALLAGALVLWLERRPSDLPIAGVVGVVVSAALGYSAMRLLPNWRDSVALWRSVERLYPESRQVWLNLGDGLAEKGSWEEGKAYLDKAAAPVEGDGFWAEADRYVASQAWMNLAARYAGRGELQRALDAVRNAVAMRPQNFSALKMLAEWLAPMGRADEVIPYVEEAMQRQPDNPNLKKLREALEDAKLPPPRDAEEAGDQASLRQDSAAAIEAYRRAIRENPERESAYGKLARELVRAKRYGEAKETLTKAIAKWPNSPGLTYSLIWLLATCPDDQVRDAQMALELVRRVNGDEQDDPKLLDIAAAAYAEAEKFDQAVKLLTRALERAPESDRRSYSSRLELYRSGRPYREGG
jgi:tetratricopeptide (TPR) repeat protein